MKKFSNLQLSIDIFPLGNLTLAKKKQKKNRKWSFFMSRIYKIVEIFIKKFTKKKKDEMPSAN